MTFARAAVPALLLYVAACAPGATPSPGEELDIEDHGVVGPETHEVTIDSEVASVVLHARDLKLTFQPTLLPVTVDGALGWRLQAKANRNLTNVHSFVFDDPFGATTLTGKRTFEIVLSDAHELNSLLSGSPLFVGVQTQTGDSRDYFARIDLAPAFARFSGSSTLWLHRDIRPVFVRDDISNLRYRGLLESSKTLASLGVNASAVPETSSEDGKAWLADWDFEGLSTIADPPSIKVQFTGKSGSTTYTKKAGVDLAIGHAGLSIFDAESLWPTPGCDDDVQQCIEDSGDAIDLGHCGSYRQVTRCLSGAPQCSELDLVEVPVEGALLGAEEEAADSCLVCTSLDVQSWAYTCTQQADMEAVVQQIIAARQLVQGQDEEGWPDFEGMTVQGLRDDLETHQIDELEAALPGSLDDPGVDIWKLWGYYHPTAPGVDGAVNLYVVLYPGLSQAVSIFKIDEYP